MVPVYSTVQFYVANQNALIFFVETKTTMAHHICHLKSEKIRANFQPREPNKKSPFLFHFVVSFYVNNPPRGTSGVEGYFLIKPAYPPSYDELLKGVKVCLFSYWQSNGDPYHDCHAWKA